MSNITTILLDMYGVILEESKGKFIPYTFNYFGKAEHERLKRQIRDEQLFTKTSNGEYTSDEFLTMLGYENPQFHMKDYIENHLTLDSGFVEFAKKYSGKYEFVLVSNDVSEWSTYITEYYQLNPFLKHKIVSGDVKCRKPDRKIYELALERIGRKASECIFVDNSVKNLKVAESLGIVPVLFNRDGEEYTGRIVNTFAELADVLEEM